MPQQMPQQMMPMGMAGGGLVAFEQGGPIRAQAGLFADPTQFISEPGTPLQFKVRPYFTGGVYNEMAELQKAGFTDAQISQMSPEQRTQAVQSTRQESKGVPSGADLEKRFAPAMAAPTAAAPGAAPGAATKPPPAAGGLGAFKQPVFPTDALTGIQKSIDDFGKLQQETPGIREEAKTAFEQESPDRISRLLEDRILRKTEEIQKDKDMSFNDALISAGAAILKSRGTPGSLGWMGEGLSAFGTAMKEGRKDIRKSEDLIDQANIDLASAQSLRDQGKTAAADRAENKAFERIQRGMALQNTKSALLLQQYTAEIAAAKLPSEIAETQAKTGYFKALGDTAGQPKPKATTAKDALEARKMLMTQAMSTPGVDINDPNVIAEIENYLKANYPGYTPLNIGGPKIRGLEAPATLAPGT
jgi:hypothetical protein